jgi:hypothetical protein
MIVIFHGGVLGPASQHVSLLFDLDDAWLIPAWTCSCGLFRRFHNTWRIVQAKVMLRALIVAKLM